MKSISTLFRQLSLIVVLISAFSLSVWGTEETATLTFNDKSKRTTFTTTQQVWTENGITLTNNKAKSTTNVADYADPARFYKSSEIIISIGDLGKIKQIVFDCNNESYASAMSNSIDDTTTISSDKVTLTLDGTSNTYTIPSLSGGQVRMDALTVTYENGEEPSIPTETLNTPSNITTKPKSQSIEVTWDAVTETNEGTAVSSVTYTLYYNNDTKLGSTTENSYEITELVPNTSYTFKIEASKTDFITSEKQIFTATTTTNTVANISEFIQREDKNELTITGAVTVIAQSSDQTHTWIQDETGAIMMTSYDVKKEYLEGNKITNLKGKYEYKYDVAQLTPTELPEATIGDAVSAEPISITDATNYVHKKVTLSNLKCTTITQDNELILSDGTDEIETYENYFEFDFTSVIEQSKFDVTAIVGKFYSTIQLYIISIDNIVLPKMYTVNFHTSENEFESYNVVENTTLNNMPSEPTSCDNTYSKFIGWTTSTTTDGTVQPELFNLESTITSNLNLYPVFAKTEGTGETESTWTLVTDESTLAVGDQVVIVAKDYNYALSTEQKSNNRGQAAVTKNNDIITLGANVQILTLEAGTKDGTFAFNTGSGYLYAASSSSNYLRTQENNNDNGSWEITITNGTASIVAQGTNTRNTMQYNQSSSLFACYGSASQKAIALYKLIEEQAGEATAWIICYIPTNNIIIESGNSLDINKTTKCNTLTIKSNLDEAGEVNVTAGALNANNIVIEKTIDASRWFFFSLPFDCQIKDIVAIAENGNPLTYDEHYVISKYNPTREEGQNNAWKDLHRTDKLNANQGYIIGHWYGESDNIIVKFPSTDAQTITAPADKTLNYTDTWFVDGENSSKGFNLIGMPYYQKVSGNLTPSLVTIPNADGETYDQTDYTNADIAPFTSFFVQVTAAPTFTITKTQSAAPMLRAKDVVAKATITLADANGGADKTTIINNPTKTTDYEIGHDLVKWIGYAEIPQIYSLQGDEMLAFNSLAIDNSTVIPLGVYAHADGDYTFSLSEKSVGDLEGWELYDNETGKTTRLANEDLTVNLAQGTHEGRFEIRLQQRISTDCDNAMGDMTTWTANGTLNINNLPADAVVYIYDAVGRMVYVANNNSTTFNYTFAARGVYNIVVRTAENSVSFKTIY
ncbi:MAG: fibronectin type III domain-containing protein [Paludibacteraceae bacterium]|nr:fibronectin type III domain-containing protein [Paludibacteraceae bacterium]